MSNKLPKRPINGKTGDWIRYADYLEKQAEDDNTRILQFMNDEDRNWKENNIMYNFITNFDWEIRGNHALTATCARITDEQKELIEEIMAETILESKKEKKKYD